MQSLKVLVITTSYPEADDGSEAAGSFVADFSEELSRQASVMVVAPGSSDSVATLDSLSVRRFAVPRLPLSLLEPKDPKQWSQILKTLRSGRLAAELAAEQFRPQHILGLWALPSGYWARSVATARGIDYSIWALGSDIWALSRLPIVRNFLRRVLHNAAARFADGYELARDVERISGQPCQFLPSVRRLPLVPRERKAERPPYRFAFLGRWHPNKGIDLLLDALLSLGDDDWKLIEKVRIFGGGPLEDLVQTKSELLKREGRPVKVGGYLGRQEAAALYAWADYLLLPSRIESIPVIFSDAMQAGCPIVATPVGDLPRLLEEHRVGLLAPSATAAGMQAAIEHALSISPKSVRDGVAAAAKDFSVGAAVTRYLEALEEQEQGVETEPVD